MRRLHLTVQSVLPLLIVLLLLLQIFAVSSLYRSNHGLKGVQTAYSLHPRLSKLLGVRAKVVSTGETLQATIGNTNFKQNVTKQDEDKPFRRRKSEHSRTATPEPANSEISDVQTIGLNAEKRWERARVSNTYDNSGGKSDVIQDSHRAPSIPQFMLVTGERPGGCKTAEGSNLIMRSYKNKVDYCNLQGCKVWYVLETWEQGFEGSWARYPALLRLMKSNQSIRWFMWMDADGILTDFSFSIPLEIYDAWRKELVVPGYADKVYSEEGDWMSLNAGVFLIKNSQWGRGFLRRWKAMGERENEVELREVLNKELPNRPKEWWVDDQSSLVYLLRQDGRAQDKVHLERDYVLHGYWDPMVDHLEELSMAPPFVSHFCGCNFCGHATSPTPHCASSFHRALNFADNQLLAPRIGLHHPNLSSSALFPSSLSSS